MPALRRGSSSRPSAQLLTNFDSFSSGSSGSMEPLLELFDATGLLLDSSTSEGSATVTFTVPATGTYYVLASDNGQNQSGSYGLSVNRLNVPANTQTTAASVPR